MKTRKKACLAFFLAAAVLFTAVAVLLIRRDDWRYRISETLRRPELQALQASDFSGDELKAYTLNALKEDSRVIFTENLLLINGSYPLSEEYEPPLLRELDEGLPVNPVLIDRFHALSAAAEEKYGKRLLVLSGYRSKEEQLQVAEEEGEKAADVSESEHRTGLALDVCVKYYAGEAFLKTPAGRFVQRKSWQYGFIIRYPLYGSRETGFSFEPWHLRYVGAPHAEIIYKTKSTLEEYVASLKPGKYYRYGEYIITRRSDGDILLPRFSAAEISPDHTGYYIITLKP